MRYVGLEHEICRVRVRITIYCKRLSGGIRVTIRVRVREDVFVFDSKS